MIQGVQQGQTKTPRLSHVWLLGSIHGQGVLVLLHKDGYNFKHTTLIVWHQTSADYDPELNLPARCRLIASG